MRQRTLKLFLILIVLICFITFGVIKTSSASDDTLFNFIETETIENKTLAKGVFWKKIKSALTSETNKNSTPEINYVVARPQGARLVGWAVLGASGIKGSGTLNIAKDYEATHPNDMVIAGVNGDYFGSNYGPNTTRGPLIIDGMLVNATPDKTAKARLTAMGVNEDLTNQYNGQPFLLTKAGEQIPVSENFFIDIYDETNSYIIKSFELNGFNEYNDGTNFIYKNDIGYNNEFDVYKISPTSDFDISTDAGYNNKVGSTRLVIGTISNKVSETDSNSIYLSTNSSSVSQLLKQGTKVRIYKKAAGAYENFNTLFGAPQQTLKNGSLVPTNDVVDYGSHRDILRARTAIGFRADGSVVLITVDEEKADSSHGATVRGVGYILSQLGCKNAFNLDGGGSTTFIVRKDDELVCVNNPSDGRIRGSLNALLIVINRTEYNLEYTEEYAYNGYTKISGSFNLKAVNGFEYTKAELLINNEATTLDPNDFSIDLESGREINLALRITYLESGQEVKKVFYNTFITPKTFSDKEKPCCDKFEIIEIDNKVIANFNVSDNSEVITSVILIDNNTNDIYNLEKNDGAYSLEFSPEVDTSYSLTLKYYYKVDKDEEEVILGPLTYDYHVPRVPLAPTDFIITLDGIENGMYNVIINYNDNSTEVYKITLKFDSGDYVINDANNQINTKEILEIVVNYRDYGNDLELILKSNDFILNVNEYVKEEEPDEEVEVDPIPVDPTPPIKKGCNANQIIVFYPFILGIGLLALIRRRRY